MDSGTIMESMKKEITQAQLLEILCTFHDVCGRLGISYSLHGGTLLGAIREKGFIPWDDDADVIMTRESFNCLEAALRGSTTNYYIRGNIKKQFCEVSNPKVWVDIFVCDYITEKHIRSKIKQLLLTAIDVMHRDHGSIKLSNLERYSKVRRIVFKAAFAAGQLIPKRWTARWYDWVCKNCFLGNQTYMFRSNDQYVGRKLMFPAVWMKKYEKVVFEGRELFVLADWDKMLIQCYGADYMTPIHDSRNADVHELIRRDENINL